MFSPRFCAKLVILGALLLFAAPSTVRAQPYPADGYVGVYFDRAGTQPCGNVPPPGPPTNLYILASLAGATQDGITGAEFRLEVSNKSGYLLIYTPAPGGCDFCMNVLDSTPCVGDFAGASLAFPVCQTSDPIAGAGRVFLGTITVINFGSGGPFTIEAKIKNPPSDPEFRCPLLVLCDVPQFTKVCMTLQEGDPGLGGQEPVAFRTVAGDSNCSSPPGCVIAVESHTWSAVKRLYRD